MNVVTSDGTRLVVHELPGDGVPVMLCHSLASSSEDLTPLAQEFGARGHRVIWFDQRGHGGSDGPGHLTVDRLAEDVIEVIDRCDAGGAIAVGHSSGGYALLALGRRAQHVVSRIVTIGTSPQLTSLTERATMAYAKSKVMSRLQRAKAIGTLIVRRGSFGQHADPRQVERVWRSVCQCSPATRSAYVSAMLTKRNLALEIGELAVPLIVIRGARDRVVSRRRSEQLARGATARHRIEIPATGHMVPIENPSAVADAALA